MIGCLTVGIIKINTDDVEEQRVMHSHSLEEMGCCTDECTGPVTHLALVEIKLINGRKLSVTKTYCDLCIRMVNGVAQA